jgi:hypothetical protein
LVLVTYWPLSHHPNEQYCNVNSAPTHARSRESSNRVMPDNDG